MRISKDDSSLLLNGNLGTVDIVTALRTLRPVHTCMPIAVFSSISAVKDTKSHHKLG